MGGTACAVLNGSNEAAVGLFLQEKIGFLDIPRLVEKALAGIPVVYQPSLTDILKADRQARQMVLDEISA
jgi:1-deoxy-D-xylulose-5-phosphate reductoisomerase